MTIKELEEKTGLARANIRYYEQQGLLSPERKENGYRDYSERDLATLQKIKLLRHLGLSIETIKQVQTGECALQEALAEREKALADEVFVLGKEITICQELQTKRVEYPALQPKTYLEQLERAESTTQKEWKIPHPEDEDRVKPVMHPWRRFFARMVDLTLYDLVLPLLMLLFIKLWPGLEGLHWLLHDGNLLYRIMVLASGALLMLFMEPLLLSRFGTTPGKALFGLSVTDPHGGRLDYARAFQRTKGVLLQGLGLRIPLLDLYFFWKCYSKCKLGRFQLWEEDTMEVLKDTKPWRGAAFVGTCVLAELCALLIGFQTILPPNHGVLTREDYIQNCNYIAATVDYPMRLNDQGVWQDMRKKNINDVEIQVFRPLEIRQTIHTDPNGIVTGVELSAEETADDQQISLYDLQTQTLFAGMAMQAAQQDLFGIQYQRALRSYARQGELSLDDDGSMTVGNVSMEWSVEKRGYIVVDNTFLWLEEHAESPCYACTVALAYAP